MNVKVPVLKKKNPYNMVTTEILKVEGEFVRSKNLLDRVFYHEKEILVILKIRRIMNKRLR